MNLEDCVTKLGRTSGSEHLQAIIEDAGLYEALVDQNGEVSPQLAEAEDRIKLLMISCVWEALNAAGARPQSGTCRDCQAPVWWIDTVGGRRNLLNPNGTSHFMNCPAAEKRRKR